MSAAILTPRQTEAMLWSCEGKTAAEIAIILDISEETARDHLRAAREVLGAVNAAQACVLFDRRARTALEALPSEGRVKGNAAVQRVIDDLSSMSEDELTWFKMDQSELIGKLLALLSTHTAAGAVPVGEAVQEYKCPQCGAQADERWDCCQVFARTAEEPGEVEGEAVARDDYLSDAQARELFGLEDDESLDEDRIRVCQGEWVRIPGGYYFDKSAGLLHPETAGEDACENCVVSIVHPAEEPGEAVAWRDMASAPKDGTLLTLLVRPYTNDEHGAWTPFEDSADPQPTIGFNGLTNTEEDRWQFAGWCWSHDHIIEGDGEVIGWAPFAAPAEEPGEVERLTRERDCLAEAIAEAAVKAGTIRPDAGGLTGPQLMAQADYLADVVIATEAALAETRERLEKVETAARRIEKASAEVYRQGATMGPHWGALGSALVRLRAALTGDAQEAGE